MHRLSHLKEVLNCLVIEGELPNATRRCLVDVLKKIFVLLLSLSLVKELLVLGVHVVVATTVRDVSTVVPWPLVFFWHVNSFLKPVHCFIVSYLI